MSDYLGRHIDVELDELLPGLPAIALEGPRAVGKTVTAARRARTIFRLDRADERAVVAADPSRLVDAAPPVLIDEWQRFPESWDRVRRAVDDGAAAGSFLLTGSAAPEVPPTHSGAGRIVRLRMRPLSLAERSISTPTVSLRRLLRGDAPKIEGTTSCGLETYVEEITASGFPAIRELASRARRSQLDSYLAGVVDRDFPDAGYEVRRPETLQRWMAAYAAASSTAASYETIRDAAAGGEGQKPAKTTAQPYREALERMWLIDPVPAWLPTRNHLMRLTAAPKHQLADPALAARLLGTDVDGLLDPSRHDHIVRDGPLVGRLFESLVTLSVRTYAQSAEANVGHVRTHGGQREIDLVVVRGDQRVLAIEVKLASVVDDHDVRHLHWLKERLGDDVVDMLVVTAGHDAYRRPDGIAVVPAALLGP